MRPITFCCNCRPWSELIKTRGTCKFSHVFPSPLVLNSARTSGSTRLPPRRHRKRCGLRRSGQRISPNEIQFSNPAPLSSRIRTCTLCNCDRKPIRSTIDAHRTTQKLCLRPVSSVRRQISFTAAHVVKLQKRYSFASTASDRG